MILIKLGSSSSAIVELVNNKITLHPTPLNLVGIFLYGTSFFLYTYLVSKNDLGYIIPLTTGIVYVMIFVASFVIFKETFDLQKIIAISLILLGVVLISIRS